MAITSDIGLGSGLDIKSLVDQLVAAEALPVNSRYDKQETQINTKITSLGAFKGALSAVENTFAKLGDPSNYTSMLANSINGGAFLATATTEAEPGEYQVGIDQVATKHSLASGSVADRSSALGTGTISIRFGTTDYDKDTDTYTDFSVNANKPALNLTIDSSNNSLEGIRDAINAENAGVTASIINDGSGYRLALTSTETGASSSMEITTTGAGLEIFDFNASATNMEQSTEAVDLIATINGIQIQGSSNTLEGAIDGVTINASKTTDTPATLYISNNQSFIKTQVDTFVATYNEFIDVVNDLTSYNQETEQAGVFLGDATLRSALTGLRRIMSEPVAGASEALNTFASIGIQTESDGKLSLDSTVFKDALDNNFEDFANLFSKYGRPSNNNVSYVQSTSETTAGSYSVNVTQLATKGIVSGAGVLPVDFVATPLVIDADNDELTLRIDNNLSGTITLTQASYDDGDELAAEIQSQINGDSALSAAGVSVVVTYDSVNNRFDIESDVYGSDSKVEIVSVDTNTAAELGFSVGVGTDGVDVAGTINGVAATGIGQELTGSNGLKLAITGNQTGDLGTVSFSRGITERFEEFVESYTKFGGLLDSKKDTYDNQLERIEKGRDDLLYRIDQLESRYLAQFIAMDALVGQLNATSSYLTQQLESLPKIGEKK